MPKDVVRRVLLVVALSLVTALAVASPAASGTAKLLGDRYVVVLAGTQTDNGFAFAESRAAALTAVKAAGGTVVTDLSRQIGVLVVQSPSATLSQTLDGSALVESVGSDFSWQAFPAGVERIPDSGPEQTADPLEGPQWDMQQIHAPDAHDIQAGSAFVDVGILDSGIDGHHPDFVVDPGGTNVDCARGRNSVTFLPTGPGVGTPDPCIDNQFHKQCRRDGRRAGERDRRRRRRSANVTLVPVKDIVKR